MSIITAGSDVSIETTLLPTTTPVEMLKSITKFDVESCSSYKKNVLNLKPINQFVAATHAAYCDHYPLTISPDIIWLTLTQGLANHINQNSDSLRSKLGIKHEGKKKITVIRNSFIRKSPENDWTNVFDEFSEKIKENIGEKTHKLIVADFSTTDAIAKAASEVVLMDAMQSYFEYGMLTCCGIPYLKIEGTVEDWERISSRVEEWKKWDLDWWIPSVQKVLKRIINVVKGNTDDLLGKEIYKLDGMSGGPFISGWLIVLFPYLAKGRDKQLIKNSHLNWEKSSFNGIKDCDFPPSLAKAPFVWNYYGANFNYQFVAGITGVDQLEEDAMIVPRIGWAVQCLDQKEVK